MRFSLEMAFKVFKIDGPERKVSNGFECFEITSEFTFIVGEKG
jgi:hypothetical protein